MYDLSFVQIAFMFGQYEVLIFQLYLVFIIVFLIPICYIITVEIFRLLSRNHLFNILVPLDKSKQLTKDHILSLAKIYIKKKQWLFCILMLELYTKVDNLNIGEYYNSIGFCYQLMNFNQLAKEYYNKATQVSPSNILFLKNLAKINYICKDFKNAIKIYSQILILDSKNKVALDHMNTLSKYMK